MNTSYNRLIIVSSLIRSQTIALYRALFSLAQNIFNFEITSRTSPRKHFSSFDRTIPAQLNLLCLIRTNNKRQPTINSPCLNILAEDDTYRAGYLTRSGILPFTLHPRPQSNDRNSNNTSCWATTMIFLRVASLFKSLRNSVRKFNWRVRSWFHFYQAIRIERFAQRIAPLSFTFVPWTIAAVIALLALNTKYQLKVIENDFGRGRDSLA